jgi:hypothetical protein
MTTVNGPARKRVDRASVRGTPGPPFVGVLKVYTRRGPLQQYRLSKPISFPCIRCGRIKTSKLISVYGDDPNRRLCNGCYGRLLALYEIKIGALPDDERAESLGLVLLSFASEAEARDAARRARLRGGFEDVLDPTSVRFIGTSVIVAEHLSNLDLDWSAAVIGLCKAFEYELVARLVEPLRIRFGGHGDQLVQDRRDPELGRLASYLSRPEESRPPEMGWIATFLVTATQSERRAISSPLIHAFRDLLIQMPGHVWLTSGDASAAITLVTRTYRNPAAHTQVLTRADFLACSDAIVGESGALWMLVDSTRSTKSGGGGGQPA